MCGIIGIASNKSVTSNIIQSLKKLEYRGYDSAGIATITKGEIDENKCTGRVVNLEKIKHQTQSLESKYQQELNSLEELKKSILEKAFEGEL